MPLLVFVCTGNTCRSPMAECLTRAMLDRLGLQERWEVRSAGLFAQSGAPASEGAKRAMQRRGLTLASHRSRPVTRDLLDQAAVVAGMSASHIAQLRALYPDCQTPLLAFDDPPISDPYGVDDAAYEQAARDLERQLPALLEEWTKEQKR